MEKHVHPRPDFKRPLWMTLNGIWQFGFDDNCDRTIIVPFAYQSEMSGIGTADYHATVWYKKQVTVPEEFSGKRVFICFGAVDYEAEVFIDGECVCKHTGGYTPFSVEVAKSSFIIAVRVTDKNDPAQPRGKQYWKEPDGCWYTPTTGIWQSVWLECVDDVRIESAAITPDIDNSRIDIEIELETFMPGMALDVEITFENCQTAKIQTVVSDKRFTVTVNIAEPNYIHESHYWWPHSPKLYDVNIKLLHNGKPCDEVDTYFGMRKVAIEDDKFMLNNQPYYLKMVLDQGYWRQSGLTPPNDEAIIRDIQLIKSFGFNGARKHQKIEDPRFYYWADKLGLLVWGELPSAYEFGSFEIKALSRDLQEFIRRDHNHPSIVAWVPLNESWGVRKIRDSARQQSLARALYHLTKACDPSRPVISNDGWEQVETDIIAIHDYSSTGKSFAGKYDRLDKSLYPMYNRVMAYGEELPENAAVMITEYGGIALENKTNDNQWGYNTGAKDAEELTRRFAELTESIAAIDSVCGFCYTQLTDVYQEVNGLLDFDRNPKVPPENIARILNDIFS